MFFVPAITRKFGNHLGHSLFPSSFKWGGAAVGLALVSKASLRGLSLAGFGSFAPSHRLELWGHRVLELEGFQNRFQLATPAKELEEERRVLDKVVHQLPPTLESGMQNAAPIDRGGMECRELLYQLQRAQLELRQDKS